MTLRDNIPQEKHAAHKVLDRVADGLPVSEDAIKDALSELGDVE